MLATRLVACKNNNRINTRAAKTDVKIEHPAATQAYIPRRFSVVGLRHVGLPVYRRLVGTVLQDDVLFAGSILDNITFFSPEPNLPWAMECARIAAIADEVNGMPMKFQTLVGDMGTVLSGGQKQRLLLARALYRTPRILVLDEATSHLDVAREAQVNRSIAALHITRILVAHRPETIASAQRIIHLDQGRIAEPPVQQPA